MFREGLRITPIRLFDKGRFCKDVAHMIASNTRDPASIIGDIQSQAQATAVCEREILRLVNKYGRDTVETGLGAVQDYVERSARKRIAALPDGE
jgi:N-methylhydantoinase B